jgi:hypothetical protein
MAEIKLPNGVTVEVSEAFAEDLVRQALTPASSNGHVPKTVDVQHISAALTKAQREAWEVLREYPEGMHCASAATLLGITSSAASQRFTILITVGLAKRVGAGRYAPADGTL